LIRFARRSAWHDRPASEYIFNDPRGLLKGSGIVVVGTLDNSAVFANALSLARLRPATWAAATPASDRPPASALEAGRTGLLAAGEKR